MSSIKILSEETINKIAAGEVVERPANVVKELLENSLDADSHTIEIEIAQAGRKLIRVRDDGIGMAREELALAVSRHATSKISDFDDLSQLHTFGFRGEALPSIASVSHLLIQSQPRNLDIGWEIKLVAGNIKESRAWAGKSGTIIEVSNLFFNTPARAKFLKSDTTERQRILLTIEELAIALPNVAFKLISEGRQVFNFTCAKTIQERLTDVLGKEFTKSLIPIKADHPFIKIEGYVTSKENSLSSKHNQFLFINKRPVNLGKLIAHSLYEAYRENITVGRHPGAVIFLELNSSEIDVNVHPTKREVRFTKEQEIHQFLANTIKTALNHPVIFNVMPGKNNGEQGAEAVQSSEFKVQRNGKNNNVNTYTMYHTSSTMHAFKEDEVHYDTNATIPVPVCQIFNTYVVAVFNNDILIIDQHAAAERIRYENYISNWKKKKIAIQGLLFPITLELSPSRLNVLKENINLLIDSGWEIEEFGTNTIRITALPAILGEIEAENIITKIIDALMKEMNVPSIQKIEKIINVSCKESIKAKDYLSADEMKRLVYDLFNCQSPYTCPHGRPTVLKIPKLDLEKHFNRK